MRETDYKLIETAIEYAKGENAEENLIDLICEYYYDEFMNCDLDEDDAIEKLNKKMVNKCKWLCSWVTKALEKENIKLDFNEETSKFIINL